MAFFSFYDNKNFASNVITDNDKSYTVKESTRLSTLFANAKSLVDIPYIDVDNKRVIALINFVRPSERDEAFIYEFTGMADKPFENSMSLPILSLSAKKYMDAVFDVLSTDKTKAEKVINNAKSSFTTKQWTLAYDFAKLRYAENFVRVDEVVKNALTLSVLMCPFTNDLINVQRISKFAKYHVSVNVTNDFVREKLEANYPLACKELSLIGGFVITDFKVGIVGEMVNDNGNNVGNTFSGFGFGGGGTL